MQRPTFFLSSTVYDFKDLRSSIKYYLEEQGCSVLASEFNDFPKPLDTHSYDACIETIEKADYFILLVGSRVGGWFDPNKKISITQQEYRTAYERNKQKKLKIISFVRNDVWQLREQRKELVAYLQHSSIDPAAIKTVASAPSKFATDADFICNFINEICRNNETKAALASGSELPIGNWVHVFDDFRDIIDTIQTYTFSGTPLETLAFKNLLEREIKEILKSCLLKFNGRSPFSPVGAIFEFHKNHPHLIRSLDSLNTNVPTEGWDKLLSFAVHLVSIRIHTQILNRAIESSAFLEFSPVANKFSEGEIYRALYQLQEEIRDLKKSNTSEIISIIAEYSPRTRKGNHTHIQIPTLKLVQLLHTMDRWLNITQLSSAILKSFAGIDFQMPTLRTDSLIDGMTEQLEKERVTDSDIASFLS